MKLSLLLPALFLMVGCSAPPSEGDVQTAIAQTQQAPSVDDIADSASSSTLTPEPTANVTVTPAATPTEAASTICWMQSEEYREELGPRLTGRWLDAVELADSTSRIALSGPVSTLQSIRQDAESLDVPECIEDEHELLIRAMQAFIDGYLAFMSESSETTIDRYFDDGVEYYRQYNESLVRLDPSYTSPTPTQSPAKQVTYVVETLGTSRVHVTWLGESGNETSGTYNEPFRRTFDAVPGTLLRVKADREDADSITCKILVESAVLVEESADEDETVLCATALP